MLQFYIQIVLPNSINVREKFLFALSRVQRAIVRINSSKSRNNVTLENRNRRRATLGTMSGT